MMVVMVMVQWYLSVLWGEGVAFSFERGIKRKELVVVTAADVDDHDHEIMMLMLFC